jgi:hypothetical protein
VDQQEAVALLLHTGGSMGAQHHAGGCLVGLTLAVALVAAGLRASQALAAVLLYRLASFWLVAVAGWLIFLWLRHRRPARGDTTAPILPSPDQARRPIERRSRR